jgi:hypothetical protein
MKKPLHIFIAYREPITRNIGAYFEFRKAHKNLQVRDQQIKEFCLGNQSLFDAGERTEIDENLVYSNIYQATGINILDEPFDKEKGYQVIQRNNLNMLFYNLESLANVVEYLQSDFAPHFELINKNVAKEYTERYRTKQRIKFDYHELKQIYSSKFVQHFYTTKQIKEFERRFHG